MKKTYDSNINENCVVERLYEDIIPYDTNIVLVAEMNNEIIDYLFGYLMNNGDAYLNKISKLEALYVKNKYRNNGAWRILIMEE